MLLLWYLSINNILFIEEILNTGLSSRNKLIVIYNIQKSIFYFFLWIFLWIEYEYFMRDVFFPVNFKLSN